MALALCLCGTAQAKKAVKITAPEVTPVARTSNSAFDEIAPLMDARIAFENGQYEKSYQNYSAAFLRDPDNIDILFGLARSGLKIGKNDIADKAYNKLASYNLTAEQSFEQFTGLVLAEVALGTSENPEARLKQALEIAPKDYRLWNALGQEYDGQVRWEESRAAYKKSRETGFSEAGFRNNLGMSHMAQKNYEYAATYFNEAARLAPQQAQFENNRRFALLMMGNYQAALENAADNDAANILGDAGYIAMQREDYSLARILLEKAIEVSPRYNQRAVLHLEQLESRQN
ncbi:tetratricopeptide repeat protein [Hellea sp.]|nr:tetratricopeptide repeat protein [Hellea sp.]